MTSLRQKQIQAHIDEEHRIKHVIINRLKKNIGSHTTPERQPDAKINDNVEKTSSRLVDILHDTMSQYKNDLITFQNEDAVKEYFDNTLLADEAGDAVTLLNQFRKQTRNSNFMVNSLDIFKKFNDVMREFVSPSISSVDRSNIKTKLVKLQPVVKAIAIGLENLFYAISHHLGLVGNPVPFVHRPPPARATPAQILAHNARQAQIQARSHLPSANKNRQDLSDSILYILNNLSLFVNINDMIYTDNFHLLTDNSLDTIKYEYITQLPALIQAMLNLKYNPAQNAKLKFNPAQNLPRLK